MALPTGDPRKKEVLSSFGKLATELGLQGEDWSCAVLDDILWVYMLLLRHLRATVMSIATLLQVSSLLAI